MLQNELQEWPHHTFCSPSEKLVSGGGGGVTPLKVWYMCLACNKKYDPTGSDDFEKRSQKDLQTRKIGASQILINNNWIYKL